MAKTKNPKERWITKSQFAKHSGKSPPLITYYLKRGKLKGATEIINGKELIDWKKADRLLKENLDPIQVKAQGKKKQKNQRRQETIPKNEKPLTRPGLTRPQHSPRPSALISFMQRPLKNLNMNKKPKS